MLVSRKTKDHFNKLKSLVITYDYSVTHKKVNDTFWLFHTQLPFMAHVQRP